MTFIAADLVVTCITIPAAPGEGSSHSRRTSGQGGLSSDKTSAGTARVNKHTHARTLTQARTRTHARSYAHGSLSTDQRGASTAAVYQPLGYRYLLNISRKRRHFYRRPNYISHHQMAALRISPAVGPFAFKPGLTPVPTAIVLIVPITLTPAWSSRPLP